ncbi:cell adhesion molecule 3-like [Tachypleus tridentatus]|uniref:cell adhesion molecule 3-like n=1 Tax=Tachypleus tridentatus TaxID=6853 RepID=UPI003FD4CBD6
MDFRRWFYFHQHNTSSLNFLLLVTVLMRAISLTTPLRLVMLDVPSPTVVGQEVELTCSFDLNGDTLYSVKWYKDDVEFYRFVPNDWPPGQFLPLGGVRVDLSKSKEQSVYIRNVALETAGVYKCEVSTEAPVFDTVSAKKSMKVYVLPTEGPKITGRHMKYRIGDTATVKCTSAKSKPAATLRWYINEKPVGPEYETVYSTILHDDGLEVSCLSLRFLIRHDHFTNGNMRLKCEASIPRVRYTMSDETLVFSELQHVSGLHISRKSE